MIDGFRIELTTHELCGLLDARIGHHRDVATECEGRRDRLTAMPRPNPESDDPDEQLAAAWPSFLEELGRRAERHRERAEALAFLREHIVADEVYRLGRDDLRLLQIWPVRDAERGEA